MRRGEFGRRDTLRARFQYPPVRFGRASGMPPRRAAATQTRWICRPPSDEAFFATVPQHDSDREAHSGPPATTTAWRPIARCRSMPIPFSARGQAAPPPERPYEPIDADFHCSAAKTTPAPPARHIPCLRRVKAIRAWKPVLKVVSVPRTCPPSESGKIDRHHDVLKVLATLNQTRFCAVL